MKLLKQHLKNVPVIGKLLKGINRKLSPGAHPKRSINNLVDNKGSFKNVVVDIKGSNNVVRIGKNTSVNNALIYIRGDHHTLTIEDNCFFGKGEFWIEDDHCSLIIHSYTTIEHAHLAVTESFSILEIHRDCMLSKHVEIRTGDSHAIFDIISGERINKAGNVTLHEHVWVGAHAIILKGVTIGNNTVIGTGSLVTRNIPPHSIAAGMPARVIRANTDWTRERKKD